MDEMDEPDEFFSWIDSLTDRARSRGDEAEVRALSAFKAESMERVRRAARPLEPVALSSVLGVLDAVWK